MTEDLKLAYDTIIYKQGDYTDCWKYYLGEHPLVYANDRLKEVFAGVQIKFIQNWCSVVVDSIKERLNLAGISVPDEIQPSMDALWDANEMGLGSDDLHEAALVCGEAFLIIWPDDDGQVEIYYNDPRMCHVFYEASRPRVVRFAAKLWQDDAGLARMTLYYPDRLEYYASASKLDSVTNASAFLPDPELPVADNPYGVVPVFRFVSRRQGIGELQDVIPIQNGINKLLTDMMVAAEYGAFRQRWIISNSDVNDLRNAPNEIWSIPAGDGIGQMTQVGEFSATDLRNYLDSINQLALSIAEITRLPKHYFYAQGGDPSGEALIAMEAPLNRKIENRIERYTAAWKKAMAFALQVSGITVAPADIEPVYQAAETIQPRTQAEIRLLDIQAGIPLRTALQREGWSDQEIDEMIAEEKTSGPELGERLLTAFDRDQEV